MSGQFRLSDRRRIVDGHARAVLALHDGRSLVFRDQRTFGWLLVADTGPDGVPDPVAHIALDPFDPQFDAGAASRRLAGSGSGIKRLLLNQTVVSGIGNIYADEALWRAEVHPETPGDQLGADGCLRVVQRATEVMSEALAAGGTSFDPLYVAVNGESGWFARSLDVYGRDGAPCPRCGSAILRERFTNRSSHRCPTCQPLP
jgi:formamidopyrimidine-DNA glycosylase